MCSSSFVTFFRQKDRELKEGKIGGLANFGGFLKLCYVTLIVPSLGAFCVFTRLRRTWSVQCSVSLSDVGVIYKISVRKLCILCDDT